MKILVASDTHLSVDRLIEVAELEQPDKIFHLGDSLGKVEQVEAICEVPVTAVRGNCDSDISLRSEVIEEIGSHKALLTHGHYYGVGCDVEDLDELIAAAKAKGCDIVMYGHTHVPLLSRGYKGMTILNPGSISSPRQPSRKCTYAVIEVLENGDFSIAMKEAKK